MEKLKYKECENCKDWNGTAIHCMNICGKPIDALEEFNKYKKLEEQEKLWMNWIPCSERLPENPLPDKFYGLSEIDTYPEYIVMIKGAEEPTFLKYLGDGEWYRDGNYYQVGAWMPLPEPYKEN